MKKIIFGLATLMLLFAGCSGDDSGGSSSSFVSTILVNGNTFTPGNNSGDNEYVITTYEAGVNSGAANARTFHLQTASTNIATLEGIAVSIIYPVAQTSVNGTYSFDIDGPGVDPNNIAQGTYIQGTNGYTFKNGSVTIEDLGNNKFKLTFNTVGADDYPYEGPVAKTITGYAEGTFELEE